MRRAAAALVIALALATVGGGAGRAAERAASQAAGNQAAPMTRAEAQKAIRDLEASLHPQTGRVSVSEAHAVLDLGDRYYFIPADEARRVLTEAWGNPADSVTNVLGMVFEKGAHIGDAVWGAVVTYEATGHVSDDDAASTDYDALLKSMRENAERDNQMRKAKGYAPVSLVGWAQSPTYDANAKSLIWARELSFAGEPQHSLNYDVRLLGRTGVLSLNMVAAIDDLADVRNAAQSFGKAASFQTGFRYDDYNASTDHTAEYGIAGLIAGGAAVAVAKKAGLLVLLLKFWKVIAFGVGAAAMAVWRFLTGRNKDRLDDGTI